MSARGHLARMFAVTPEQRRLIELTVLNMAVIAVWFVGMMLLLTAVQYAGISMDAVLRTFGIVAPLVWLTGKLPIEDGKGG